jgi:hypothetical protein
MLQVEKNKQQDSKRRKKVWEERGGKETQLSISQTVLIVIRQ